MWAKGSRARERSVQGRTDAFFDIPGLFSFRRQKARKNSAPMFRFTSFAAAFTKGVVVEILRWTNTFRHGEEVHALGFLLGPLGF
jgi:hypothetical protein